MNRNLYKHKDYFDFNLDLVIFNGLNKNIFSVDRALIIINTKRGGKEQWNRSLQFKFTKMQAHSSINISLIIDIMIKCPFYDEDEKARRS